MTGSTVKLEIINRSKRIRIVKTKWQEEQEVIEMSRNRDQLTYSSTKPPSPTVDGSTGWIGLWLVELKLINASKRMWTVKTKWKEEQDVIEINKHIPRLTLSSITLTSRTIDRSSGWPISKRVKKSTVHTFKSWVEVCTCTLFLSVDRLTFIQKTDFELPVHTMVASLDALNKLNV